MKPDVVIKSYTCAGVILLMLALLDLQMSIFKIWSATYHGNYWSLYSCSEFVIGSCLNTYFPERFAVQTNFETSYAADRFSMKPTLQMLFLYGQSSHVVTLEERSLKGLTSVMLLLTYHRNRYIIN